MAKESKVQVVEEFAEQIDGQSLIFFDYKGVDVTTLSDLRKQCREQGSRIKVLKNTLLKRALDKQNMSVSEEMLQGMTAVLVASNEGFGSSGKVLLRAETDDGIAIKGGFFEAATVDAEGVRAYAKLPGREELYGMLVGALEGIVNNMVVVLGQVAEQKASGAGADVAAPPSEKEETTEQVKKEEPKVTDDVPKDDVPKASEDVSKTPNDGANDVGDSSEKEANDKE